MNQFIVALSVVLEQISFLRIIIQGSISVFGSLSSNNHQTTVNRIETQEPRRNQFIALFSVVSA